MGGLDFDTALARVAEQSAIFLESFSAVQQSRILDQLSSAENSSWILITDHSISSTTRSALQRIGWLHDELLPGHRLAANDGAHPAWRTGDVTPRALGCRYDVWIPNNCVLPSTLWEQWLTVQPLPGRVSASMPEAASTYWADRQDGAYLSTPGTLAACDGSAKGEMGAAAVWQHPDGTITSDSCKVFGPPSSFRSEAAAMHIAVDGADRFTPVTIFTDSMNVIFALRSFNTCEFDRDMRHQRNADIIRDILRAINLRQAPTHIVKVKSHRGVYLNELADQEAGAVCNAAPEETDTRYCDFVPDGDGFSYTWVDEEGEIFTTTDHRKLVKRWHAVKETAHLAQVRAAGTIGGTFLATKGAGRHLLAKGLAWRPHAEALHPGHGGAHSATKQ